VMCDWWQRLLMDYSLRTHSYLDIRDILHVSALSLRGNDHHAHVTLWGTPVCQRLGLFKGKRKSLSALSKELLGVSVDKAVRDTAPAFSTTKDCRLMHVPCLHVNDHRSSAVTGPIWSTRRSRQVSGDSLASAGHWSARDLDWYQV
jgi:hypothetical protein